MNIIAKIISFLFFPLFMPLYGIILLFKIDLFSIFPTHIIKGTYLVIVLFCIVIPLAIILIQSKLKIISDIRLYKKEDRIIPYICIAFSYLCCAYSLNKLSMPLFVSNFAIASAVAISIDAVVSKWWKISAHMTGIGGIIGGIIATNIFVINAHSNYSLALCISIMVAGLLTGARLYLERHTPLQLVAGFINGFVSVILVSVLNLGTFLRYI